MAPPASLAVRTISLRQNSAVPRHAKGSAVHFDNNRLLRGSASIRPCTNRKVFCDSARTPRTHLGCIARPRFSPDDLLVDQQRAYLSCNRMVKGPIARNQKRKENGYPAGNEIGSLQPAKIRRQALASAANDVKDHRREENAKACNQERIAIQERKVVISDQYAKQTGQNRIRILDQRLICFSPRQRRRRPTTGAGSHSERGTAGRASRHFLSLPGGGRVTA